MSTVFFFRGLNTYGDDLLRFGPFNLGESHRELAPRLESRGFRFVAIPGSGRGPLPEQIERSLAALSQYSPRNGQGEDIHLLGHSAGGVLARGLSHRLEVTPIPGLHLKSVVTLNSPNFGSKMAEYLVRHHSTSRLLKSLRFTGYDIREKLPTFQIWQPQNIVEFNRLHPNAARIRYGSIVSRLPRHLLPHALRLIQPRHPEYMAAETDGIVESTSQPWGEVICETQLDHGAALGLRTVLSRQQYVRNLSMFEKMTAQLIQYMKDAE
jgi:hypothetical protein